MKTISLIIPHKNSSKLLERLLRSIPPTLDFQIIVIDDNSYESELSEVEKLSTLYNFELYYNNFELHTNTDKIETQANLKKTAIGAGAARNVGLQHATGDWILFADADDFFLESISDAVLRHLESDYDVVYFNISSCHSDTLQPSYRDNHIKNITQKYLQTGEEGYLRYKYISPWGKLIKRSLLTEHSITFEPIISGNDMIFSTLLGLAAGKIYYDPTAIYMLTRSANSLCTTHAQDTFDSKFMATLRVNKLLRKRGQGKFQSSILYFLFKSYQFGFKYVMRTILMCIKYKSNIFIGMNKIFNYKKVLKDRHN
ncbi:MAG: glycosyltransferase family 2 protein [Rikenellaceae bacterium]